MVNFGNINTIVIFSNSELATAYVPSYCVHLTIQIDLIICNLPGSLINLPLSLSCNSGEYSAKW